MLILQAGDAASEGITRRVGWWGGVGLQGGWQGVATASSSVVLFSSWAKLFQMAADLVLCLRAKESCFSQKSQ